MPVFHLAARFALAAGLAASLAGCDTLGMDFGSPGASAPAARAIDYRNDDLPSLVFALDVPTTVKPAGPAVAMFDLTNGGKGDKHIKASLTLADGSAVDSGLPPPASGRTYYLFAFSAKDKATVASAQKWLKSLAPDAAPVTALDVEPKLCATGTVDATTATFSIVPALPGAVLMPIASGAPIASLITTAGGQLPACS